ncbi:Interferon-induced very large GTPase 1-like isoform X3 [Oopsacas minuta]|uniref:Interferon-induced very large GTPase 1-like isoform X3 n=1 Tax=Oopsacas minuta TaxID=111878 RepID=A0AAV7KHG7_9METZ|nr:Interferon-induced very large GTPase 1-like isoform X3 [Oopsacas minuta]
MFLNLRGDALNFDKQLSFVLDVSTIVYVFITLNDLEDNQFTQLSRIMSDFGLKICLVFMDHQNMKEKFAAFKKLPNLCQDKYHVVRAPGNVIESAQAIQKGITYILNKPRDTPKLSISECQKIALKHGIIVDEEEELIKYSLIHQSSINEIIESEINSQKSRSSVMRNVKALLLPLQLDNWEQYSQSLRELHRIQKDSKTETSIESRQQILRKNMKFAMSQQFIVLKNPSSLLIAILNIIVACQDDIQQLLYFWRGLQILLDHLCLKYSSLINLSHNITKSKELPTGYEVNNNSLGLEHIYRELCQVYEAYTFPQSEREREDILSKIAFDPNLIPKMFANLLLYGHSFEILDGFVNLVPSETVTSVLSELSLLVGENNRIFVVSIIGIQSSGKSTLLNTMFGLHFPVSSGRCTRGVFMQFIAIDPALTSKLGYNYLVVLDTEGLRAPELSGEISFSHDNELATFVVGLCDLTIINLFGEDQSQFQDILQIAVLALIRMQLSYNKPRCIFVHQNVSDINARQNLSYGKQKFLDLLDEMTRCVAKLENCSDKYNSFRDVIEYDPLEDTYFFPSLYQFPPPMSIVSDDYSNMSEQLKSKIVNYYSSQMSSFLTITDLRDKLDLIWNSLLKENFVFNYQNVRERNAAFEMDQILGNWTSNFGYEMYKCQNKVKNAISICTTDIIDKTFKDCHSEIRKNCKEILRKDQNAIMNTLFVHHKDKDIFRKWESRAENHFNHIRERKKFEICEDLDILYKYTKQTLNVTTKYKQQKDEILVKAKNEIIKQSKDIHPLSPIDKSMIISNLFERLWAEWSSGISEGEEEAIDITNDLKGIIETDCLDYLHINQGEKESINLEIEPSEYEDFGQEQFKIIEGGYTVHDQLSGSTIKTACRYVTRKLRELFNQQKQEHRSDATEQRIYHFIDTTSAEVSDYIKSLNQSHPYNISYFEKLIRIVVSLVEEFNERDWHLSSHKITLTPIFKYSLSLHQCCRAIPEFRTIHTAFKEKNNTNAQLARIKNELEPIFSVFCQGTQIELSCAIYLSTIIFEGMKGFLGTFLHEEIVPLFLQDPDNIAIFTRRSSLQFQVLKELADREDFTQYIDYISNPINYLKDWIKVKLSSYCTKNIVLDNVITSLLNPKIQTLKEHYLLSLWDCFTGVKSGNEIPFREYIVKFYESVKQFVSNTSIASFDFISVFDNPISNSKEFLQYFSKSFQNNIENQDWKIWITQILSVNLNYRLISDNLLQCKSLCPFCAEPCLLSSVSHDHYCCSLHRPAGINGMPYKHSNKFVATECTLLLKMKSSFILGGITYKMEDYRTVNEYFSSWKILEKDAIDSKYWKWIFYKFCNQFMDHYHYEYNSEIENWSDLNKEEAISNLTSHYQTFLFKTNK